MLAHIPTPINLLQFNGQNVKKQTGSHMDSSQNIPKPHTKQTTKKLLDIN